VSALFPKKLAREEVSAEKKLAHVKVRTPAERIYTPVTTNLPLQQGELLTNIFQYQVSLDSVGSDELSIEIKTHPYAIILSQACDLDLDRKNPDKPQRLPNILLCEVEEAAVLRPKTDSRTWDRIKINKDERYHFLQAVPPELDIQAKGLPELGLDFKRYFSIPQNELYKQISLGIVQRRTTLQSPYLEHLSSRYAAYLSRIGLPFDHESQSEA